MYIYLCQLLLLTVASNLPDNTCSHTYSNILLDNDQKIIVPLESPDYPQNSMYTMNYIVFCLFENKMDLLFLIRLEYVSILQLLTLAIQQTSKVANKRKKNHAIIEGGRSYTIINSKCCRFFFFIHSRFVCYGHNRFVERWTVVYIRIQSDHHQNISIQSQLHLILPHYTEYMSFFS